jgi:hypothetical protein
VHHLDQTFIGSLGCSSTGAGGAGLQLIGVDSNGMMSVDKQTGFQDPKGWMPEVSHFAVSLVPAVKEQTSLRNSLYMSFVPIARDKSVTVVMGVSAVRSNGAEGPVHHEVGDGHGRRSPSGTRERARRRPRGDARTD